MEKRELRLGELFCGPGGIACGALKAKVSDGSTEYRVVHGWANDIDKETCDTYIRNICPESPESVFCADVRDLDVTTLPKIDAFAYGFPCNDFSIVGEKLGFKGKYGPLYSYGIDVLNHFQPVFFVAENVGGMASSHEGKGFSRILSDLKRAGNGYEITTHLYKSEYYGVPQTRHRIVIVGIDKGLGVRFQVPAPTTLHRFATAGDALMKPPILPGAPNNERTTQSDTVVSRLRHIKPGENAWTAKLPPHLRLNVKGATMSQIYKRLSFDKPSYTVTGSGGGGTHVYHWDEPRALTNRERARLQTFPDDFIFEGAKECVRRQIGMAVPPRLSEVIFTAILKTIAKVGYETVEPHWNHQDELFSDAGA